MKTNLLKLISTSLFTAAALTTLACSPEKNDSTTQSIATDLPDSGSGNEVHLYWINSNFILRGLCDPSGPILRSNCNNQVEAMDYDTFKVALDAGLSQTIQDLRSDVRSISAALNSLESQMDKTLDVIDQKEAELGQANRELVDTRASMERVRLFINEYRSQLALIDVAIWALQDPDLIVQRDTVAAELGVYRNQLFNLQSKTQALMTDIGGMQVSIAALKITYTNLMTRFDNLKIELSDTAAELEKASDDFSVYKDTLEKLDSNIIYRVLADQTLYKKNRMFVKRFERIFANN